MANPEFSIDAYAEKVKWCKQQHRNRNHLYDGYLPYEFHLNMVAYNARKFVNIISEPGAHLALDILIACYGHDLIEDAGVSYNDCKKVLGENVADIIYAVTNEKGKTRAERANDKYYNEMRQVPGAIFVKLCDRIANVQYSKMTYSGMLETYKQENDSFVTRLKAPREYDPIIEFLWRLFQQE